jgi:hypothetical protein
MSVLVGNTESIDGLNYDLEVSVMLTCFAAIKPKQFTFRSYPTKNIIHTEAVVLNFNLRIPRKICNYLCINTEDQSILMVKRTKHELKKRICNRRQGGARCRSEIFGFVRSLQITVISVTIENILER